MTKIKNSRKFFCNHDCEYFPCHRLPAPEEFNCLFCYCPLYVLGKDCGGNFEYSKNDVKICMDCHLPHTPEYYGVVVETLMLQSHKNAAKNI